MWKFETNKAYPFRHRHPNHFPPPPPTRLDSQFQLSPCIEEEFEVPIVFRSPVDERKIEDMMEEVRLDYYDLSLGNSNLNVREIEFGEPPPTPSSIAPAKMTGLLQEVLGIMNGIMDEQAFVQEEDELLRDLTELVVIMQEEAEAMMELADLVEEYVEEVDMSEQVLEIEEWVQDLDLSLVGTSPENSDNETETELEPVIERKHAREESFDSAVGMDFEGDEDGLKGELRESVQFTPKKAKAVRMKREGAKVKSKSKTVEREQTGQKPDIKSKSPLRTKSTKPILSPPKKGKTKKTLPPFRDSGMDLSSPTSSPSRRSKKSPAPPRWI